MNKEILGKFNNTLFATQGGSCFECCDYEAMYEDLVKFIDNNFSKNQNIKKMKTGKKQFPETVCAEGNLNKKSYTKKDMINFLKWYLGKLDINDKGAYFKSMLKRFEEEQEK